MANLLGCLRPSVGGGLCIALLLLILVEKGDFLKLRPLVQKLRQKGEPSCHDLPQSCIVALGRQAEAAVEKFLDIRRGVLAGGGSAGGGAMWFTAARCMLPGGEVSAAACQRA
jgi:hypothetical protein